MALKLALEIELSIELGLETELLVELLLKMEKMDLEIVQFETEMSYKMALLWIWKVEM